MNTKEKRTSVLPMGNASNCSPQRLKKAGWYGCATVSINLTMRNNDENTQGNGYPKGIKSEKTMKKVIILSSSPRKGGNSDLLCDRFMEGAAPITSAAPFFTKELL